MRLQSCCVRCPSPDASAPPHADDARRAPTTTAGVSLGMSLTPVHWMHSTHKPDVAAPRTLLFSCIQRTEYVPVRGFTGFDSPRLHGKTLRVFGGFRRFRALGVPWGIPYSVRCVHGWRYRGGRRCGYFCSLSGRRALVSGSNGFGYPGPISGVQSRMDNVIMQRGIVRCGSQSNPRLADAVYAGICFRGGQSRRLGT